MASPASSKQSSMAMSSKPKPQKSFKKLISPRSAKVPTNEGELLKIMHWNILSDYRSQLNFKKLMPKEILEWSYRSFLI
jgi:hypothetical protein